ncbi:MAG: tetratricopeptide repeat protein [Treponema sp.]|jgi:tetratricopeptide (TPR) repeat protein|nr:tetratricopeptide repeat protein [Treponema sp.]
MKRVKETVGGLIVVAALVAGVLWVYNHEKSRVRADLAKRIAELTPRGSGLPEGIDGLRQAITLYETQIEQNVKEGAQTGVYWKILGIRLADKKMHRDAIAAFERAIQYNAEDPTLFYLVGESASIVASGSLNFSSGSAADREHYTSLAESAYLRAIQLDAGYSRPLLGLGILYTFDMNRPREAIPYLERYVNELSRSDIKGMFVLARAYYMTENYNLANDMYDRILSRSKDPKVREEAMNNKEIVRNLMYG